MAYFIKIYNWTSQYISVYLSSWIEEHGGWVRKVLRIVGNTYKYIKIYTYNNRYMYRVIEI